MARIPEAELQRLKEQVPVERLVEASGVELKRGGKDLLGRCPFHQDDDWNVLGVSTGATVEDNMASAERWYEGITPKWIRVDTTREAAEKFVRDGGADSCCSFCGNLALQVDHMFSMTPTDSTKAVRICSDCVEKLHKLATSEDAGGS